MVKETKIPARIYINIDSAPNANDGRYQTSEIGETCISVYESLDGEHIVSRVEHVQRIGGFRVKNTENMKVDEFLSEVRKGIRDVIGQRG